VTTPPPEAGIRVIYGAGYVALDFQDGNGQGFRSAALTEAAVDQLSRDLLTARRQAFGILPPSAAVVEIIERGNPGTTDGPGSVFIPNDVRINGVSVYTTGGVKIHEISLVERNEQRQLEMATVTLTLPVRRVTVAAEGDLP